MSASIRQWIVVIRPWQWLKNLMIYFPPFLGGVFFQRCLSFEAVVPFAAFCLVSSSSYLLNDLWDRTNDLLHPKKCRRPIAAGLIRPSTAITACCLLASAGVSLGVMAAPRFALFLVAYLVLSAAYTIKLKDVVLVDIFCISAAFLVRLQAGAEFFGTPVSEWLFLCVFLLSVFLSTGKRLGEKMQLGPAAAGHRKALDAYPQVFLEGSMYMTGAAVLVSYSMYVLSRHSTLLLASVPLCCFGLLRLLLRIHSGKSGDPTESLLKDVSLFLVGATWALLVGWGIYGS